MEAIPMQPGLPVGKQYAIFSLLCLSLLQVSAVFNIIISMLMAGSLQTTTPLGVLVLILAEATLQFLGLLYVMIPSPKNPQPQIPVITTPVANKCPMLNQPLQSTSTSIRLDLGLPQSNNIFRSAGSQRSTGRHPMNVNHNQHLQNDFDFDIGSNGLPEKLDEEDSMHDNDARLQALADLEMWIRGLNSRPEALNLDDFICATSEAITGIFPGVHHISFCIVSSTRTTTNVYTFLGEEGQPLIDVNVEIAPGTLLHHIVSSCKPVFVADVASLLSAFPDLQVMSMVMGLQSLACLPLMICGQSVMGILRLGFPFPRDWGFLEQSLTQQVASILCASSLCGLDGTLSYSTSVAAPESMFQNPDVSPAHSAMPLHMADVPPEKRFPGSSRPWHAQHMVQPSEAMPSSSVPSSQLRTKSSHRDSDSQSAWSVGDNWATPGASTPSRTPLYDSNAVTHAAEGSHSDVMMLDIIGRGGFSCVYKGTWQGNLVAVKVMEHGEDLLGCYDAQTSEGWGDPQGRRAALLEGALSSAIKHPNVVQTYDVKVINFSRAQGLPSRMQQETHIIMEYCAMGSLQDAIDRKLFHSQSSAEVNMEAVAMTLAEVASAMEYLHAHRITHRDLKPKNILLKASSKDTRGFRSMVSDFGLSQMLPDSGTNVNSTKHSGTVTHMPPELIEEGKVYQQGDAYAFGILMWEIYTGTTPYPSMAHPQIMVAVVTHDLRPKFPDNVPDWYRNLACKCWRKQPLSRPSFKEITGCLMSTITDPTWSAVGDAAVAKDIQQEAAAGCE